jgi:hypothetical protein
MHAFKTQIWIPLTINLVPWGSPQLNVFHKFLVAAGSDLKQIQYVVTTFTFKETAPL